MLTGQHLIAGTPTAGPGGFQATDPATGAALPTAFAEADADTVDRACDAAEAAFAPYAAAGDAARADLLDGIAGALEADADAIVARAMAETALPEARLRGEMGRTTGQLRLFAGFVRAGRHLEPRHDPALPDRSPLPRPDLRLLHRPLGPVAVFGASNFPLAFSVAGGDTASALAAGCPVVVKAHPAHPGTSELVGAAITQAVAAQGLPGGVFSLLQGAGTEAGVALVRHQAIRAVGFTGSLRGGRALYDLACARPEPIPLFAEMGSINPQFLLPEALAARGPAIAAGWVQSLTLGVGQFCTNPGLVVGLTGAALDTFVAAAGQALADVPAQPMLAPRIAQAYRGGVAKAGKAGARNRFDGAEGHAGCAVGPALFEVEAVDWLANPALHEEVFGPAGLVVHAADAEEMRTLARALEGQLTATLHLDTGDHTLAQTLLPILERKAGRLIANGFPTGVEVCDAMMHGGPYPATTDARFTSVGTLAIRRFLRPVCYQDWPDALLPAALRGTGGVADTPIP